MNMALTKEWVEQELDRCERYKMLDCINQKPEYMAELCRFWLTHQSAPQSDSPVSSSALMAEYFEQLVKAYPALAYAFRAAAALAREVSGLQTEVTCLKQSAQEDERENAELRAKLNVADGHLQLKVGAGIDTLMINNQQIRDFANRAITAERELSAAKEKMRVLEEKFRWMSERLGDEEGV